MQNNNKIHLMAPPAPITAEQVLHELKAVQFRLAFAINIIKDKIFNINSPEDMQMFEPHFVKINEALKIDPRALLDPANVLIKDIPIEAIQMYSLLAQINPLFPPDPSAIQIVKT